MPSAITKRKCNKDTFMKPSQKISAGAAAGYSGIESESCKLFSLFLTAKPVRFLLHEILHLARCIGRLVSTFLTLFEIHFKLNYRLDFLPSYSM